MNLFERIIEAHAEGRQIPLKGKARISLRNVETGETEVHEQENIITNAVASILAQNMSGLANFSQLIPLKQLYNGILLFEQEITQNAENYNVPSELENHMVANAGSTAAATQSDTRGNPNATESEETATSIKMVWDWPTSAGNGTIRTACLVPGATLGNMSTRPIDATMNCWKSLAINNDVGRINMTTASRAQAIKHPISIGADGQTGKAIWWQGSEFEEITIRKDVSAFGILRGLNDFTEVSSRTASVRTFTDNKANIFEDANYYYLYEATYDSQAGKYGLKIDKVSKDTFAVTQADIYYETVTLFQGNLANNWWRRCVPRYAYDGKYLYFPNSAGNGFTAVNPNDSSDKMSIDGTFTVYTSQTSFGGGNTRIRPVVLNSGVIYGENYLINGSTAYPIKVTTPTYVSGGTYTQNDYQNIIRNGAGVWAYPFRSGSDESVGQGPILLSYFLSSIMVLQNPVTKGTSQTMKVEYTLTEVPASNP